MDMKDMPKSNYKHYMKEEWWLVGKLCGDCNKKTEDMQAMGVKIESFTLL
jgi:hypothetical protein